MKIDQRKLEDRTLEIIRKLNHEENPCRIGVPTSIRSTQVRGLIQALCEQLNDAES